MMAERIKEVAAMVMIGDGILGTLSPEQHLMMWRRGPAVWEKLVDGCLRHPELVRAMAMAEVAAGIWLARHEWDRLSGEQPSLAAGRARRVLPTGAARERR